MKLSIRHSHMVCLSALLLFALPLQAKDTATPQANVEQQYKNCPNGYYSGPRPGRVRYTKDPWLWVVTPQFAQKFCMPPEFVSTELKGAEAVAFKISERQDEEVCGWGDKAEVCSREKNLRFEIYTAAKLPKARNVPYFSPAKLPSNLLISSTEKERKALDRSVKETPRVGALGVFETQQIGLHGIKDGKVVWPIVTLYTQLYYAEVFEGLDFLAVEGSTGFFTNPRMEKLDIRRFVIAFRIPGEPKKSDGRPVNEFAHVIELPESYTDKVRVADKARGMNIEELGKRALGIAPVK